MPINHCVLTIKQTIFDRGGRAAEMAKTGDATAKRLIKADTEQKRTIDTVRATLAKHKVSFTEISAHKLSAQEKKQINGADLVISIGGDGTALSTSHYITTGMLLGVNSAPGDSIGHFCHAHRRNFATRFAAILNQKWRPSELVRLAIFHNEKRIPEPALNDVLIAHDCPASTTRYILQRGTQQEEHRSSGIWVAAPAGSTAGIKSAGGKVLPLHANKIQYLVRELYREPNRTYALTNGILAADEQLIIASKMQTAHLYIDGARTAYPFPFGTRARIQLAPEKLKIFLATDERP